MKDTSNKTQTSIPQLRRPNYTQGRQFKLGAAMFDRLSESIVFIDRISWNSDGRVDCLYLINSEGKSFYRSPNAVRKLSLAEKLSIWIEDGIIGGQIPKKIKKYATRVVYIAVILIYAAIDPLEFIRDTLVSADQT